MRQPGDFVRVAVEGLDLADDGRAYGSVDGRRVRIEGAIPGELVEVRLPEAGDAPVELLRVVEPSPQRVTPRCPYFGPCGGCTWQHIGYAEQLRIKQRLLEALLEEALGAAAPPVPPTLAGEGGEWGFRSKVHFVLGARPGVAGSAATRTGALVLGHYRRRSQQVIEVDECPVHADAGNRIAFAAADALRRVEIDGATPDGRRGIARHVVVRVAGRPGAAETLLTLVVTRSDRRLKRAVEAIASAPHGPDGLAINLNDRPGPYLFGDRTSHVHGRRRVRETLAGVSFLVSATAFFQTNVRAAEAMVRYVLEQAGDARSALDLYAGAGLFALPLATRGVRVVAVEENREAVADGEASRQLNRIAASRCAFVAARAEQVAGGMRRRAVPAAPDLVVLDPPRAGCPRGVLEWICDRLRPRRVIYISCDPHALARDLRLPIARGYAAQVAQPVDMFPHTSHIETVAVLTRSGRQ